MPSENLLNFGFRRGSKAGVPHTPQKNGFFIFTTDTEEMYVDIDDKRLTISGVVVCDSEEDIRDVETPGDKLYVAKNTKRIMTYNHDTSEWIYVSTAGGGVFYGTCNTSGSDQTKIVTIDVSQVFELKVGVVVAVKFTNTNTFEATVSDPVKMNINSSGAYNIYYANSNNPLGTNPIAFGEAGYVCEYMYDGTNWVWVGRSDETIYHLATTASIGLSPALKNDTTKYLRSDGTWNVPPDTTYGLADSSTNGLMPSLSTASGVYLDGTGLWSIPHDTTYGTVSTAADGLAPVLPSSSQGKFLKDTGTWEDLPTIELTSTAYNELPEIDPAVTYLITDDGPIIRDDMQTPPSVVSKIQQLENTIANLTARIEELENHI